MDSIFLDAAYTDYDLGKYSPKLFKAMDVEEVQYVACIYMYIYTVCEYMLCFI